jgi:hypothetical protein
LNAAAHPEQGQAKQPDIFHPGNVEDSLANGQRLPGGIT